MERKAILVLGLMIIFAGGFLFLYYRQKDNANLPAAAEVDEKKQVALTFDDGPHAIYTPQLLKGLKERGVKATFFVIGENAEQNPEIIAQMYEEGHLIGNHTMHHVAINQMSWEEAEKEVGEANDVIASITGERPEYIRPPYGECNDKKSCPFDMILVFWNVDTLDWKVLDSGRVVENVIKNVEDGDIILLHDIYETSVEAALIIVDRLQAMGYEFVTVDELLME
ncbi:MAG: polysaccharide deacetylase family protein [Lachnospiraceae bacterium]